MTIADGAGAVATAGLAMLWVAVYVWRRPRRERRALIFMTGLLSGPIALVLAYVVDSSISAWTWLPYPWGVIEVVVPLCLAGGILSLAPGLLGGRVSYPHPVRLRWGAYLGSLLPLVLLLVVRSSLVISAPELFLGLGVVLGILGLALAWPVSRAAWSTAGVSALVAVVVVCVYDAATRVSWSDARVVSDVLIAVVCGLGAGFGVPVLARWWLGQPVAEPHEDDRYSRPAPM